jgi:hypothetical protein
LNPVLAGGIALWLVVGVGVAYGLRRGGHEPLLIGLAVPCWPLFVHRLDERAGSATVYAARIAQTLTRLAFAAEAAGEPVGELGTVREALDDADDRLARLDALLLEDPEEALLLSRRAEVAALIEAALADLGAIRLQLQLMTVDGAHAPKPTAALAELRARLHAAQELRG